MLQLIVDRQVRKFVSREHFRLFLFWGTLIFRLILVVLFDDLFEFVVNLFLVGITVSILHDRGFKSGRLRRFTLSFRLPTVLLLWLGLLHGFRLALLLFIRPLFTFLDLGEDFRHGLVFSIC